MMQASNAFFFPKNRKADILIENIIFIILNLVFISILLLFLWKQGSGAVILEQTYAKQISLIIDSSKPVMEIKFNMDRAKKLADKNKIDFADVVSINGNNVVVRLSQKGGYEYSFFKEVHVEAYPERDNENEYNGVYVFTINQK